jgi:hypothetical protein
VAQYDAGHGTRVLGPQTDPGAYEYGAVFSDGFDSGETTAWSVTRP